MLLISSDGSLRFHFHAPGTTMTSLPPLTHRQWKKKITASSGSGRPGDVFHFSPELAPSFFVWFFYSFQRPGSNDADWSLRAFWTLLCPKWTSWLLGRCLIPRLLLLFSPPPLLSSPNPLTRFPHASTFFSPLDDLASGRLFYYRGNINPSHLLPAPVSCSHGDPLSCGPDKSSQWE